MICREYGYIHGASAFSIDTFFQSNPNFAYVIEDLKCSGEEYVINDCDFSINWDFDFDITLFGVVCKTEGKTEVNLNIYLQVGPRCLSSGKFAHHGHSFKPR